MHRNLRHRILPAVALSALLMAAIAVASAENIDPVNDNSQFAWGENVGWINAEPSGPGGAGIQVASNKLTGYMYGENIGWINLSCTNNNTCGTTGNYGVTNNGQGKLGGYAWAENAGWISFSCLNTPASCASISRESLQEHGKFGRRRAFRLELIGHRAAIFVAK